MCDDNTLRKLSHFSTEVKQLRELNIKCLSMFAYIEGFLEGRTEGDKGAEFLQAKLKSFLESIDD